MPLTIPLVNVPRQTFTTEIYGNFVRLTVWWQTGDSWYLSLESPPGNNVFSGQRMVLNSPISTTLFPGSFICRALSDNAGEPGRRAWGTTHVLEYEA